MHSPLLVSQTDFEKTAAQLDQIADDYITKLNEWRSQKPCDRGPKPRYETWAQEWCKSQPDQSAVFSAGQVGHAVRCRRKGHHVTPRHNSCPVDHLGRQAVLDWLVVLIEDHEIEDNDTVTGEHPFGTPFTPTPRP